MIHQNLVFGNLITSNQLEWLAKKQKILLKSPKDMNEKKTKPIRLFRSTSFKTEQHALLLSNPKNYTTKSPMLLKPQIEKNGLKKLPFKTNPSDELGKSEKSITSSQRRSSAPYIKIKRRWSYTQYFNYLYILKFGQLYLQIQGEKYKRLNKKAPKNIIKYHYVTAEKEKKKKLNRLRMQYKFISRLQKNKFRKLRSKTLPLTQFIRMRHTRAKTFAEDQHQGPILNLEESLKRKINMLVLLRKSAMRRHTIEINQPINTCFQMPKKSVLVSKEKLLNYQKQISDNLVKTESQVEFSPALDQILVYQRRVNFTDIKQSFKIAQQKKKCFLSGQFKKQSHSIEEAQKISMNLNFNELQFEIVNLTITFIIKCLLLQYNHIIYFEQGSNLEF